jgi:hypothetical protein
MDTESFLLTDSDQDTEKTMTINEEVFCKEYAPAIFAAIRKMDGIT